jgi:hypothetical protein
MINDFISGAKGLTRNPLGIIALFVSLIYGFACLVLSTSISNLNTDSERLPLIWFIILFPLVILIAFLFLVVKHHEKLYSPGDFRGDDSFIQTIDKNKLKEKKLEEVKTLESAPDTEQSFKIESTEVAQQIIENKVEEEKEIEHTTKKELTETELLEIYSKAELWSSNELSLKYNTIFKSNVQLSTQSGKFEFDAYASDTKATYIVEIKYWQINKSDKKLKLAIQNFLSRHSTFERLFKRANKDFKIIIVLVFDNLKNVNKTDLIEFTQNIYKDSIIEFFDYNELRKNYE